MTSVMTALITHLKTVAAITALASTRIYGGQLPEADVASMPRKCIVLRHAGGPEEQRSHRVTRARIDVFAYGEGYLDAESVDRAVCDALMALSRTTASSTLLHVAGYGGPRQLKEPDHGWPFVARTALVAFDERAAA